MNQGLRVCALCLMLVVGFEGETFAQAAQITTPNVLKVKGRSVCTDRSKEPESNQRAYRAVESYMKEKGKSAAGLFMIIADDVLFDPPDVTSTVTVYVRGKCGAPRMKDGGQFYIVRKDKWETHGGVPPAVAYMAPHWIRIKDQWVMEHGYLEH